MSELNAALDNVRDARAEWVLAQECAPDAPDGNSSERDAYLGSLESLEAVVRRAVAHGNVAAHGIDTDRLAMLRATADETIKAAAPRMPGDDLAVTATLLAVLVRAHLGPAVTATPGTAPDADTLAAEADAAARKAYPPVPGVTEHNGFTVRAVMPYRAVPREGPDTGLSVAAESRSGQWMTHRVYCDEDTGECRFVAGTLHGTRRGALRRLARAADIGL